ncbi:hotdog family protein [Ferrimonas balearica]|uniref:ApeP family dehydratase n=1 Tax=Ferrimonas balearica TaxID=44012 RepID=UPI001C59AEB7|nr:hotdog family protein [Ferrimonas balearica]MBW3164018.1 hotdog family protein [Ferrimonas balearica]MBY6224000.1 hotdog family protein [Ferrimonas balearica]
MTHPLAHLLPHDEPMILIDQLVQHDTDRLVAAVTPTPESPFFDPQHNDVPGWVGIEYMAQAVAALAGLEAQQAGRPVRIGFLLGSRRYELQQPAFMPGLTYHISVERLYQDPEGMASFDCAITLDQAPVASAKLSVFQPNDITPFLEGKS